MDHHLPYEILLLICSLLDREDLKRIRFVSRRLASAGLAKLNVKGDFVFRKDSFERLQAIAKHPVLSRNLEKLTFFVDVVPKFEKEAHWETQAYATCAVGQPTQSDKDLKVPIRLVGGSGSRDLGWQQQQNIRAEQELLLLKIQDTVRTIRQSLARLFRLGSFSLDTLNDCRHPARQLLYGFNVKATWYCWNSTCGSESFNLVCTEVLGALLEARCLLASQPLNVTVQPLKQLEIRASGLANFNTETLPLMVLSEALGDLKKFVLQSHTLDRLTSSSDFDFNPCTDENNASFFQQALGNMKDLEELRLWIELEIDTMRPPLSLHTFIGKGQWSSLRILDLANFQTHLTEFQGLLSHSAQSLISITLCMIQLSQDDDAEFGWPKAFKFMGQNLNLDTISIVGLREKDGPYFDDHASIPLASTPNDPIEVYHALRWLVCGCLGEAIEQNNVFADLSELTWDHLLFAYP